jgi:hypothetical protein
MDPILSVGGGDDSFDFDVLSLEGMDFGLIPGVPSGDLGDLTLVSASPCSSGPQFKSKIIYNGFKWTKKDEYKKTAYYQCPSFRAPMLCKATLKFSSDGQITVKGSHTCGQEGTFQSICVGAVYDAEPEMKMMIVENCLHDQNKAASDVAKSIFDAIVLKYRGNNNHILYSLLLSSKMISVGFHFAYI